MKCSKRFVRGVISLSFCVLVVTGCGNGTNANLASEEIGESDTFDAITTYTPEGFITFDGRTYEMISGGFMWEYPDGDETVIVQTDAASPVQIAENDEPIVVQPAAVGQIELDHPEEPILTAYIWREEDRYAVDNRNNDQLTLPTQSGPYIYEVVAQWSYADVQGEVSYTFVVDVQ